MQTAKIGGVTKNITSMVEDDVEDNIEFMVARGGDQRAQIVTRATMWIDVEERDEYEFIDLFRLS